MIACIIIVCLAFVWLGYETKCLTIRLPRGPVNKRRFSEKLLGHKVKPDNEIEFHDQPTVFIPTDLPELTGDINIICRRE